MSAPQAPPLLQVADLVVRFPGAGSLFASKEKTSVKAVNRVSLALKRGETLGLVGESGSGKSTLGRAILRLGELTAGQVLLDGIDIAAGSASDISTMRRKTAMIFQDPYGALNPRQTVGDAVGEVLRVHKLAAADEVPGRVEQLFELVGLDAQLMSRRPKQLSGGQCQRVGIARALAIDPALIIADECVAALDVSIQGQIINLLIDLRQKRDLAMIFIAHDLAIVRQLCDRVAVMYLGHIVEEGPTEQVFNSPKHPYTASLIRSIPEIDPGKPLTTKVLRGEPPSPVDLPSGCPFHPRCPVALAICRHVDPQEGRGTGDHTAACIRPVNEWREAFEI